MPRPLHQELQPQAHAAVKKAREAGELTAQPCEICGKEKAEAHHDDYSKPLEVRWLCRSHHGQHHGHAGANIVSIRVALDPDEWRAIRMLALDNGEPTATLVGRALRESLLEGVQS